MGTSIKVKSTIRMTEHRARKKLWFLDTVLGINSTNGEDCPTLYYFALELMHFLNFTVV